MHSQIIHCPISPNNILPSTFASGFERIDSSFETADLIGSVLRNLHTSDADTAIILRSDNPVERT